MNSVVDIGGNIGSDLDSVALFPITSENLSKNWQKMNIVQS